MATATIETKNKTEPRPVETKTENVVLTMSKDQAEVLIALIGPLDSYVKLNDGTKVDMHDVFQALVRRLGVYSSAVGPGEKQARIRFHAPKERSPSDTVPFGALPPFFMTRVFG